MNLLLVISCLYNNLLYLEKKKLFLGYLNSIDINNPKIRLGKRKPIVIYKVVIVMN